MNASQRQSRLGIKEVILAVTIAVCTVASATAVALALAAWTEIATEMLARGTVLVGNPPWWIVILAVTIISAEGVVLTVRLWRYLVRRRFLAAVPAWVQPTFGGLLLLAMAYLGVQVFVMHRSALFTEGLFLCVLLVVTSQWFMRRRQTQRAGAAPA